MKQHPVPQNISSYQFRLVGEMTLKQFVELAGGLATAYLVFSLPLPSFIKWPLIVFFALLGFALAFLPIQERPLDCWIINFIKSIYAPTSYIWRKNNPAPEIFKRKPKIVYKSQAPAGKTDSLLKNYLATLSPIPPAMIIDKEEKQKIDQINQLWQEIKTHPQPSQPSSLTAKGISMPVGAQTKIAPAPPLTPPISVDSLYQPKQKIRQDVAALFPNQSQIIMPNPPDIPNLLSGIVLNTKNNIVPNVLIEIKNNDGQTLRALKTNKLGQFFTASPLENGDYIIHLESNDCNFDPIRFKAGGKPIPPFKIKAKS